MSDLAATNCGCGCGCESSNSGGCNCIFLILILLCCCGGFEHNGCGCGNGCGSYAAAEAETASAKTHAASQAATGLCITHSPIFSRRVSGRPWAQAPPHRACCRSLAVPSDSPRRSRTRCSHLLPNGFPFYFPPDKRC